MFFALACALRPTLTTLRAWLAAVMTTELIEFSELYRSPWLDALRATRGGGLLLGHALFLERRRVRRARRQPRSRR